MPLGSSKSVIDDRPIFRIYRRLFGAEDMHSHYRWNAIRPFIDVQAEETLEVGGGDGRMAFELVDELDYPGSIVISELDPRTVAEAEETAPCPNRAPSPDCVTDGSNGTHGARDDFRPFGFRWAVGNETRHVDDD